MKKKLITLLSLSLITANMAFAEYAFVDSSDFTGDAFFTPPALEEKQEEIPVKEKDGRYTVHITLKVRETDVLDAIRKHVMANERLQKVFRKEKFDELWNE